MSESANVEVPSAEVRVLQMGSGQITLSMYRQLDEATFERFKPFGRVRDNERSPKEGVLQLVGRDTETGVLVRCDAYPPDWSPREGSSEFAHCCCILSNPDRARTRLSTAPTGARWYGPAERALIVLPRTAGMSVRRGAPQMPREEERAKCCTVDLGELDQAWHAKAEAELAELLELQAEYDQFKALPLIVLA
jgi:hypothetical protein